MPDRRLLMRKIREVLRLKYERGLSHRAIAQACAIGVGTVTLYLQRTSQLGLGWPLPAELDDAALEARLFHRPVPVRERVRPDCAYIYRELKRDGVTLQLLWEGTSRSIRAATATRSSASSTGNGRGGCGRRYGRCTAPARRRSSTSPASGRAWSTGVRVSCDASSCSSPCSAPAASPTPRRPRPSSCRPGSTRTVTWWSTSAAPPRCGSPTSSRAPSPAPAATSPASTAPTRTGRPLRRRRRPGAAEETSG